MPMRETADHLDGFTALKEAIRSVPIPGAPPPLSREGAAVGLAFLDMALRQNHVRRLTERLSLVEHQSATRTTEVDVRLSLLDVGQREASSLFQRVTSRSTGDGDAGVAQPRIWVPVTRISRLSVSPIDVVDASGSKLPRLTQYETSRLLASGLYRLLRGILSSHPDSRQETDLGRFLFRVDESRWLVQAALVALLTDRTRPLRHESSYAPRAPGRSSPDGYIERGEQYRAFAIGVLDEYQSLLETYSQLLAVAVNDYLLVAALDASKDDHLLSYDSPVHVPKRVSRKTGLRNWLPPTRMNYRVQYVARIPSSLRSYHMVAETQPGVHIQTMSLVTDADRGAAKEVGADLLTLAQTLRAEGGTAAVSPELVELELQTALGRLSELLRTRQWDANQADLRIPQRVLEASDRLVQVYRTGDGTLDQQSRFRTKLAKSVAAEDLQAASMEIEAQEIGFDFSLENHPVSTRAHAYWRRSTSRPSIGGHVLMRCTLTLRDATGARPGSVAAYGVAVATTIYAMACFLSQTPWPYGRGIAIQNPGAVITVLLLVPGFLYTRLDLPGRHTILGRLRSRSRQIAHMCIGSAILLASAVAAGMSGSALRWIFVLSTFIPVVASALLFRWTAQQRETTSGPLTAPQWLRPSKGQRMQPTVDAVFYSSGSDNG
jgi:hypothetical protein